MNEVNETLRGIRNSIEEHTLKINQLNTVINYINHSDVSEDYKDCIKDCIFFKQAFHLHKIEKLHEAREELMDKYYKEI